MCKELHVPSTHGAGTGTASHLSGFASVPAELLCASVSHFAPWDSPAVPAPVGALLQGMEQDLEGGKCD